MGHGNHWLCVFPDLKNGIAEVLRWVSQRAALGQSEYAMLPVPGGDAGATVSVIAWPSSGLRANYVLVRDKRSGRAYLHTAFPAAPSGCRHKIRIDSVHDISCGLEARISGVLGDAAVTFFDPLYCLNRDGYRPGAFVDIELAGIAYSMKIVPRGTKQKTAAVTCRWKVRPSSFRRSRIVQNPTTRHSAMKRHSVSRTSSSRTRILCLTTISSAHR